MPPSPRILAGTRRQRLLSLLADGDFHSGEQLARKLRVSRGGVWKLINSLKDLGVEVESIPRRGYRLPRAVQLLDEAAIARALPAAASAALESLDVRLTVDSTNHHVSALPPPPAGRFQLCAAEVQTAGRGRRGRSWVMPFGSGICMSVGWQFNEPPPDFSALSLAVGVAVVAALRRLGAGEAGLKWPNDLLWQRRKLGGILIEMRGESAGPAQVIIGIGINMRMPAQVRLQLAEQEAVLVADVHEMTGGEGPGRNELIGAIAGELYATLGQFAREGFAPFAEQWRALDTLADAPVKVISSARSVNGIARGADQDGSLLVEVDGEVQRFVSGEVSLRPGR